MNLIPWPTNLDFRSNHAIRLWRDMYLELSDSERKVLEDDTLKSQKCEFSFYKSLTMVGDDL